MVLWDSWTSKAGLVVERDAQAWLPWGLEVAWVCGESEDGELSHEGRVRTFRQRTCGRWSCGQSELVVPRVIMSGKE